MQIIGSKKANEFKDTGSKACVLDVLFLMRTPEVVCLAHAQSFHLFHGRPSPQLSLNFCRFAHLRALGVSKTPRK